MPAVPFLTLITPTFRRPAALRRCMDSVQAQTAVGVIEHVILPDYIGRGVGGMFTTIPYYAAAVHGDYVHILADDDELAAPDVVARLQALTRRDLTPKVAIVRAIKGAGTYPDGEPWPPVLGRIDLGCCVTRRDVWAAHVTAYGSSYEGDYHFMAALARAGHPAAVYDLLFLRGAVSYGRPEEVPA